MDLMNDIDSFVRSGVKLISLPSEVATATAELKSEEIQKYLIRLSTLEAEYNEVLRLRRETLVAQKAPAKQLPKYSESGTCVVIAAVIYQIAESNCPALYLSMLAGAGAYQATSKAFGLYKWWQQSYTEAELKQDLNYADARSELNNVTDRISKLRTVLNYTYQQAVTREKEQSTNNIGKNTSPALTTV